MAIKVVSFNLGEEIYAVRVEEIGEILRVPDIAEVPNTYTYVEGVINLRGNIVPVINLNKKFNLNIKKFNDENKIIVIDDEEEAVGILVDRVNEVVKINEKEVEEAPDVATGIPHEVFEGVININGRMLILLDIKAVLKIKEEEQNHE